MDGLDTVFHQCHCPQLVLTRNELQMSLGYCLWLGPELQILNAVEGEFTCFQDQINSFATWLESCEN